MAEVGRYREAKRERGWGVDFLNNAAVKNRVYGFVELDVTRARAFISERKAEQGESLSFTAWVVKCIAQAVSEHREVQGYIRGPEDIVVFDDVDVAIALEREVSGEPVPVGYVVRKANEKSFRGISDEIRGAKVKKMEGEVLSEGRLPLTMAVFSHFPRILRKVGWWKFRRDPFLKKRTMGTVGVTSVGMFGKTAGWAMTLGFHSLEFAIGGIARKPTYVDGRVEPRDMLNLTVMFDEDVTYGAPAARFVARLVELAQTGFGLALEKNGSRAPGVGFGPTSRFRRTG